MVTRRRVLAGSAALTCFLGAAGRAQGEAILTDDGLFKQPWFLESFLELADDLDESATKGKRFAVIWELRGCPYCKEMHLVNFARPEVEGYVKSRFEVLQLNIIGSRVVTDFDGEKLSEKQLAAKYDVRFTPVILFFPERAQGLGAKPPRERECARIQGYLEPRSFHAAFKFVAERGYETDSLENFLKASG
jgi:thioredoxin-related protein